MKTTSFSRRFIHVLALSCLFTQVGCGSQSDSLAEVDPDSIPENVNYRDHVGPRINYYCTSCHNPDGMLGSAGGWDLSSYDNVVNGFDRILSVIQEQWMPPGSSRKPSPRDEAILERWQELGFPEDSVTP